MFRRHHADRTISMDNKSYLQNNKQYYVKRLSLGYNLFKSHNSKFQILTEYEYLYHTKGYYQYYVSVKYLDLEIIKHILEIIQISFQSFSQL